MSSYIEPATNLSEAWLRTLEHVVDAGGHAVNVITTITDSSASEDQTIRSALDEVLSVERKGVRVQPVETVAGTIFPHDIYADTGLTFTPSMDNEALAKLDASAADLYACYLDMLPILTTDRANNHGTYFGRMVSWPGKTGGGTNQLADRIMRLRRAQKTNVGQRNLEDITSQGRPNSSSRLRLRTQPGFRYTPRMIGANAASPAWSMSTSRCISVVSAWPRPTGTSTW